MQVSPCFSKGLLALLVGLLLSTTSIWAQQIGSNDDCRSLRATPANAKQDFPVDVTVVVVVTANQGRCEAVVENIGSSVLRCMSPTDGTPTPTTGYPFIPGKVLALGLASQRGWQCVRDTDAVAAGLVSVLELFP